VILALQKPWGVLSQFTPELPGQRTLAEFGLPKDVWPLGRLDRDSEGLLLLTDEKPLVKRLLEPSQRHPREYQAQLDREITPEALFQLQQGVIFDGKRSLPARAALLGTEPDFPPRDPPIRFRKNVPTCWISLELTEGRNRQVRKMTAAVGFPTLRLVRVRIGNLRLPALPWGRWQELNASERGDLLG
jgi:23S rRNA pseudouridine2457 synthase